MQSVTKLKKVIQDSKETVVESDVRSRMQPLKEQIRGYWDQMGQVDLLLLLLFETSVSLSLRVLVMNGSSNLVSGCFKFLRKQKRE